MVGSNTIIRKKIQSISEFVVLVYMLRNKSQLETFAHRRSEFKNFHRDIAEYLIGVWEENGWKDLMILEYEQYFQIEASSDETYQALDSHSQRKFWIHLVGCSRQRHKKIGVN